MVWILVQIMFTFICIVDSNFLYSKKWYYWHLFQKYCLLHISDLDYCRTYCKAKCCVLAFTQHLLIKPHCIQKNSFLWNKCPVRLRLWWKNLFLISYRNSQFICDCVREFKWDFIFPDSCLYSEFCIFEICMWYIIQRFNAFFSLN